MKKLIRKTFLYSLYKRYIGRFRFISNIKRQLYAEAVESFSQDCPPHGTLEDYKDALNKHMVSYSEYMYQYEFWRLNEEERGEFISRNTLRLFYYDIPWDVKILFWDKVKFLNKFSQWIFREWFVASQVDYSTFKKKCSVWEGFVAKPMSDCCGTGIFKISNFNSLPEDKVKELYEKCVENNVLIEECIIGCYEIQSFHPSSLNSIRVVTVNTGVESVVFGSFLRIGVGGGIVDNAHAGGLFAQINVETGIVESEGISVDGRRFLEHPDTAKLIKGFEIPRWKEICEQCINASRVVPQNIITGWDVILTKDGHIEFVEGNHGPDFDVMQSPLKIGVKRELYKLIGVE